MKTPGKAETGISDSKESGVREPKFNTWQKQGILVLAVVLIIGIGLGLYDLLGGSRGSIPETSRTSSRINDTESASPVKESESGGTSDTSGGTVKSTGTTSSENTSTESTSSPDQSTVQPEQDDDPADGTDIMTLDKYNRIETGMTYEEVVEITGSPGINSNEVPGLKPYGIPDGSVSYAFPSNDPSNLYAAAIITFKNNRVIGKYQNGLK